MKPDGLRMLGWVIPIMCMAIAAWISYKQREEFILASDKRNLANRDVEEAQVEKQKYEKVGPEKRFAAVDDVPEEETTFLTYLRTTMAADGVTFDKWLSQSIEYGKDKLNAPKDERTAALLKGIRKISSTLTLTGSYSNIRKLVGELEASDHLYTLSNLNWNTTKTGLVLTMTVSRYVAPAKPAPPKPAAPPKSATPPVKPAITVSKPAMATPGVTSKP